jgi:thymidylate kinase
MIFVLAVEHIIMLVLMQIGLEPNVVLFFDCPEEEMVKRVLNRNQVHIHYIVLPHSNM